MIRDKLATIMLQHISEYIKKVILTVSYWYKNRISATIIVYVSNNALGRIKRKTKKREHIKNIRFDEGDEKDHRQKVKIRIIVIDSRTAC